MVALDADTRFLDKLGAANLEVWRADVVQEPLPEGAFDLVHTRFLLQHLPERERVLEKLARAVKPGGHLIVFDSGGAPPVALQDRERFDRFAMAFLAPRGAERLGSRLGALPPAAPRASSVSSEIRARAFREYVTGSDDGFPAFVALSIDRLRERLLATRLAGASRSRRSDRGAARSRLRVPDLRVLGRVGSPTRLAWRAWRGRAC